MNPNLFKSKETEEGNLPWIFLLIQSVIKHWLSLIFVVLIFIVFRMPHLSDLTVVIIQKQNHYLFIPALYAAIVVMAVLISYGYLVVDRAEELRETKVKRRYSDETPEQPTPRTGLDNIPDAEKEVFDEDISNGTTTKLSMLRAMRYNLSLKDSKEQVLMPDAPPADDQDSQDDEPSEGLEVLGRAKPSPPADGTKTKIDETPLEYMDRVFPKFLGTFMILSIAFSVNATITELFGQAFVPDSLLWIILFVFIILTHRDAANYIKDLFRWNSESFWMPMSIVIVSTSLIVLFGVINQAGTPRDMRFFFISLFLLAVLFFTLNVSYNERLLKFKTNYVEPLVFVCFALVLLCYIWLCIFPSSPLNGLTPMVILMFCLIGMYVIFTVLKYFGAKTGWPILTMVFFGAIFLTIVFAKNSSFKHYEVTNTTTTQTAVDRMDLETYVDLWIAKRAGTLAAASKAKPFPIIMVSAEGGGSRAGHWALLVHSYLYEQDEAYFKDYLFSITGASGGSVGSNIFYTQAYERHKTYNKTLFRSQTNKGYTYKASDFYQNDYISSSIAGFLGRDLFASVSNFSFFRDRGELTELEWEAEFNTYFDKGVLGRSYLDIMPNPQADFIPPIMVTTTTHVQSGAQYIMSPVTFEPNEDNEMLFKDLLTEYQEVYPDTVLIKRSTAMLLTARFPYLSPNGRVTGIGQFGDGGYYDNIGGLVTRRLEQALLKGLDKVDSLQGKYEIRHLIIRNATDQHFDACSPAKCICPPKVNYNSQLLTPALMVVNATFAPADEFVASYPADYRVESKRTLIPIRDSDSLDTICDKMYRPLIPLGRYMSKASVMSLEARLKDDEVKRKLDRLLRFK